MNFEAREKYVFILTRDEALDKREFFYTNLYNR